MASGREEAFKACAVSVLTVLYLEVNVTLKNAEIFGSEPAGHEMLMAAVGAVDN
jgi:hypothetical protein